MSLHVPAHRLSTIGRRSLSVAAPTTWNSLPADVQSSTSLPLFRQRLKTYLFKKSFPDVILFLAFCLRRRGLCDSSAVKAMLKNSD